MPAEPNFQYEYGSLLRFLTRKGHPGYIFAIADDQRLIPQINKSLVSDLSKSHVHVAVLYLQRQSDMPLFYQVRQAAQDNDALIIANAYAVIDDTPEGTDALTELNFARESFVDLDLPILFWADKSSLSLISNKAPDLFSQRRLGTVYFTGVPDRPIREAIAGPDKEVYLSSEKFSQLEQEAQLLEKRLEGAIKADYPIFRLVKEIALPLAKIYAEMGLEDRSRHLIDKYNDVLSSTDDGEVLTELAGVYQHLQAYFQAISVLEKLMAIIHTEQNTEIEDWDSIRKLAYLNYKIGENYEAAGDLNQALSFFLTFSTLQSRLYEGVPDNSEYANYLSVAFSRIGWLYEQLQNYPEALEYYRKDLALSRQLYANNPKNTAYKYGIAVSLNRIGGIYGKAGMTPEAMKYYEEGRILFEEIMNEQPRNQIIIQSLTDLLSGIGDIYAQTGDYREALTYFQSGLAYAQQLCKADPREKAFLDSLAMFYFQIGETYMHLNDAVSAKMYLLRANEILTEIDRNFPNNIDIAKNLNSINVLLAQLA